MEVLDCNGIEVRIGLIGIGQDALRRREDEASRII
jgi:hypothetical protein